MSHLLLLTTLLAAAPLPHWQPSGAGLAQRVETVSTWMTALDSDVHEAKLRETGAAPAWTKRDDAWKQGEVHFGVGSWLPGASVTSTRSVRLAEFYAASRIRANGGGEAILLDWYVEPSGKIWALAAAGPVFTSLHRGMRALRSDQPVIGGVGHLGRTWSSDDEQRQWQKTKRRRAAIAKGLNPGFPTHEGYIPREIIDRVIAENLEAIHACARKGKRPVTMKWVITAVGTVVKSKAEGSPPPALAHCLVTEINGWRFPTPDPSGVVVVTHAFALP